MTAGIAVGIVSVVLTSFLDIFLQLQEKFRLDLDDEEAVQFFQSLINDSVSALFPQVVETIHRWAQYWR
jgi:phosphatidylinositol kinase/protein kinase (PI-3  family)